MSGEDHRIVVHSFRGSHPLTRATGLEQCSCAACSTPTQNVSHAEVYSQTVEDLTKTVKNKTVQTTSLLDKWTVNFVDSKGQLNVYFRPVKYLSLLSHLDINKQFFSSFVFLFEMGSHYIAQTGLELLGSSIPPASSVRTRGECQCTQPAQVSSMDTPLKVFLQFEMHYSL